MPYLTSNSSGLPDSAWCPEWRRLHWHGCVRRAFRPPRCRAHPQIWCSSATTTPRGEFRLLGEQHRVGAVCRVDIDDGRFDARAASCSAAESASQTRSPVATRVTSLPWRSRTPLPISNLWQRCGRSALSAAGADITPGRHARPPPSSVRGGMLIRRNHHDKVGERRSSNAMSSIDCCETPSSPTLCRRASRPPSHSSADRRPPSGTGRTLGR